MAGNSPLSTSAARRAQTCRSTPAYAPSLSHATLLLAPEVVRGWHAARLVLTALWSRLLSLRICFVRRRSPDPVLRPTVGLQVTRRRSGTGSPAVAEEPQVTAMATITVLSRAAQRRQIGAWSRQPHVTAMGQSDPLPRTPHGQWTVSRQRFGVNPPGLGRVGHKRSFLA